MNKQVRRFMSIGLLCISMLTTSFASVENTEIESENINHTATLYEGKVRVNTLGFDNQKVKDPVLLYKGSYYLPMTPEILSNLGLSSGLSSEGILTYTLDVPRVDGRPMTTLESEGERDRVDVFVYEKQTVVDDMTIEKDGFHPVIIYNNTFYLPLNKTVLEEGLETDIYFSEDKTLTLLRDMDKMPRGTILEYPSRDQQMYLETVEKDLRDFKEELENSGQRHESEGQVQYFVKGQEVSGFYVLFENGDWQVVKLDSEEKGHILYYYAASQITYVGEYVEGSYSGIGRLRDKEGHVTAIKPFSDTEEPPYTERDVAYDTYMPTLGVLVSFSDENIIGSDLEWYEKFFGEDENSLSSYYKEVTDGKLTVIPALDQNREINDGLVRVKLDQKHPNTGDTIGMSNELLMPIFEAMRDEVNLSIYDKNDNGVIDRNELTIVLILAGYESSIYTPGDYPQFRSHHIFSDISLEEFDGTGVLNIIYMSELSYFSNKTELATTSVLAHEFGHQLGLPDLYDTDGSSKGLGPFSLMAEGTNNYARGDRPGQVVAPMDPWSRIQLEGIEAELVTTSGEYELHSADTGMYNVLRINTDNPGEYFLVENRQLKDRDTSLKTTVKQTGGILVYHIDESIINENYFDNLVNADENKKGVDIEEASERSSKSTLDDNAYQDRHAPFFTAKGTAIFGGGVKPFNRLNDGSQSGISIEVLSDGPTSIVEIKK